MTTDTKLMRECIDYLRPRKAKRTIETYARTYEELRLWLIEEELTLLTADASDLDRFTRRSRLDRELSSTTVKRRLCELRTLYRWLCHVKKARLDDPSRDLDVPKARKRKPKPVSDDVWVKLWGSPWLTDADRVALGLAFFCGLRRGEITALSPRSIVKAGGGFANARLVDFGRKGDGGADDAVFPMGTVYGVFCERRPDLVGDPTLFTAALRRLVAAREGSIHLMPWADIRAVHMGRRKWKAEDDPTPDSNSMNRRMRTLLERSKIASTAATPHMLRHAFGTNLLRMGMDVMDVSRLMNHEDVKTTQGYLLLDDDVAKKYLRGPDDEDGGGVLAYAKR